MLVHAERGVTVLAQRNFSFTIYRKRILCCSLRPLNDLIRRLGLRLSTTVKPAKSTDNRPKFKVQRTHSMA